MSHPKPPCTEEGAARVEAKADAPVALSAEEGAALLEAEADADAGRVVPHSEVAKWLKTWGTPDEKPMPESWRRQPLVGRVADD
jgi:hypothetical protein